MHVSRRLLTEEETTLELERIRANLGNHVDISSLEAIDHIITLAIELGKLRLLELIAAVETPNSKGN